VLLAQRRWVWAPVQQTPLQLRHRQLQPAAMARRPRALPAVTLAGLRPETSTPRTDPAIRADLITPAVPVAQPDTVGRPITRADPVGQPITRADPVGRANTRADPVGRANTRADPVGRANTRADPVAPRHGMGMPSVATSTGPHGATDPPPGDRVNHRGRTGADRSRRPEGHG
jgi:hypothetical protein